MVAFRIGNYRLPVKTIQVGAFAQTMKLHDSEQNPYTLDMVIEFHRPWCVMNRPVAMNDNAVLSCGA